MASFGANFLLFFVLFACQALGQVPCGDNSTYCPSGSTCCPLDSNTRFGCCPIPDAVCCTDRLHCCPSGMQCDTAHAQCTNGQIRLPMYPKSSQHHSSENTGEAKSGAKLTHGTSKKQETVIRKAGVYLEAGRRECRNGDVCEGESTCCYDESNEEAYCCPTLNGKCCKNGEKCCARGFVCSSYGDECVREKNGVSVTVQMFDTNLAGKSQSNSEELNSKWITCPDNSQCPKKNTCCKVEKNAYRCCPLAKANCCETHCCSREYTCATNGQCEKVKSYDLFDFLFN